VINSFSTRASSAIAVSFAVGMRTQEKRVLFQTLSKADRDETILAFVPSVKLDPPDCSSISARALSLFVLLAFFVLLNPLRDPGVSRLENAL